MPRIIAKFGAQMNVFSVEFPIGVCRESPSKALDDVFCSACGRKKIIDPLMQEIDGEIFYY